MDNVWDDIPNLVTTLNLPINSEAVFPNRPNKNTITNNDNDVYQKLSGEIKEKKIVEIIFPKYLKGEIKLDDSSIFSNNTVSLSLKSFININIDSDYKVLINDKNPNDIDIDLSLKRVDNTSIILTVSQDNSKENNFNLNDNFPVLISYKFGLLPPTV